LAFFGIQFFVGAPAEFGRLQAFRDEALDRPGVPERVERLRVLGALGIALGDVHALDADLLHQLGPAFAVVLRRLFELDVEIPGKVHERLLDEPGDHARISAAGGDRGRAAGVLFLFLAQRFAQRIVGAVGVLHALVEVEAEPGFDDRVDIEHVEFAAELDQVERAGVDREVDAEALAAAFREERLQEVLVVLPGDMGLDMCARRGGRRSPRRRRLRAAR
jgi:hypothetical protein